MSTGHSCKRQCGITLIELMIVVVIIGILSAIAYPAYTRYVQRANQASAQTFMLDLASRAESYRMDARDYPTSLTALGMAVPADIATRYTVVLAVDPTVNPALLTITATAKPGSPQAGMATLILSSNGDKTPAEEW